MTPKFIVVTDTEDQMSVCLETDFIISICPIPSLSAVIQEQSQIPKGAKTAIRLKNMMNLYCDEPFMDVMSVLGAVVAPGSIIKIDRPKVVVAEADVIMNIKH